MNYTKDEIDIFKRVRKNYSRLKEEIDERIKKGYKMDNLLDYVRHLATCDVTNYDLVSDYKYIDINFCDMNVSILEHNGVPYLGETIEVWNDNLNYYIDLFNSTKELEKIIKEYE